MRKFVSALVLLIATSVVTEISAQEATFLLENRTEISLTDLPIHVKTVLDSKEYDGWKIVAIYRSDDYESNGPNARYLIRLQYEVEFKDVYLNGAGLAYEPN